MFDITNARIAYTASKIGNPTLLPVPEEVHMCIEGEELDRLFDLNLIDPTLSTLDQVDLEWNPTLTPKQCYLVSLLLKLHKAARQEQRKQRIAVNSNAK